MKLLVIFYLIFFSKISYQSQSNKSKFNIRDLRTPKGLELNNHFGSNPLSNAYGPKPELIMHEALFQNSDGSVVKKYVRTIAHGDLSGNEMACDITQKDFYAACLNIKDCDLCTASPHCGWCELRKTCLPSRMKESACPNECINGWKFGTQSCSGSVKSGRFGRWPYETDHIRTVEYTYPKYRVETVITTPQVVRTPVLLGTVEESNTEEKKNALTNTLSFTRHQNTIKPIYGEIHQVLPVDVHMTQYIDSFTGNRVDPWGENNIQLHGTDDINISNDFPSKADAAQERRMSTIEKQKLLQYRSKRALE